MEDAGVIKLYELHRVSTWLLQRTWWAGSPLSHVFWLVTQLQQSHKPVNKRKDSGLPFGCAETAAADGRRGSNVYEVNPWLRQFGRGKPRLGGLTVKETTEEESCTQGKVQAWLGNSPASQGG